jgi:hypothetical protein
MSDQGIEQRNLFADIPSPQRMPKMVIPREARQPVIDYFAALSTRYREYSYEDARIQAVLHALQKSEDPVEEIMQVGKQQLHHDQREIHEFYLTALEMLYVIRHHLETEYIQQQSLSGGEVTGGER